VRGFENSELFRKIFENSVLKLGQPWKRDLESSNLHICLWGNFDGETLTFGYEKKKEKGEVEFEL